ncbi:PTB domain-containing engulfment adapter protein 1 isoform X1 [Osmia lignaria lignaria]|uniref:PTB domain-containing engulfment adapter protein 1-like isoform X2 n=1 Tax=Osmia bicornis bicornis TaxID=1437191 RepID=UPI0010F7C720|nr:PTB domain-containing engulfment adapter protein 1-like isoform X2 [Osmia bicornis bicornis]XP_034191667.1 PTB domain-containing engulfment adapter protein 1-like isoform X1 [Osmia lignaria]XP_034191668.1 PTB domain-containing engulfment adapter protein 1-like isoform X1 [Osmia lignaria]XP_034191669.1 PTB domain-containing engulfment adapter protein 1-like isoform X1 [Osmia lignaria]XP_034191670.1 PTB domain-containing engulfment adapter protein 1-like isoform X1 [Osmia lignaria]XP_03419167
MRNSTLLKWAQNSANSKNQTSKNGTNRSWIHPPDALQKGHIAYLVKYLGSTEVDQPKGIEVVKEAICKLKFNQQLRKSEGTKTPKVELTISIDGVAIQEPKTKTSPKRIMHQYPLHRISYCADDKGEKKFFSFIAKEEDAERHTCFVFVSDKLAEEITLTIGQAFDLAYRRFLETSGKDLETQRRCMILQQKIKRLEHENNVYRQRLQDIAAIKGSADVSAYLSQHNLPDILHVAGASNEITQVNGSTNKSSPGTNSDSNGNNTTNGSQPPPVPPRSFEKSFDDNFMGNEPTPMPSVGTKLEGLLMDEFEEDFNPRAYESAVNGIANHQTNHNAILNGQLSSNSNFFSQSNGSTSPPPLLAPPPKAKDSRRQNGLKEDLFGSVPFNPAPPINTKAEFNDPFEMGEFGATTAISNPSQQELENAIGLLDKKLLEMKDGFSRGLSIDTDDFSLESLDPLRN